MSFEGWIDVYLVHCRIVLNDVSAKQMLKSYFIHLCRFLPSYQKLRKVEFCTYHMKYLQLPPTMLFSLTVPFILFEITFPYKDPLSVSPELSSPRCGQTQATQQRALQALHMPKAEGRPRAELRAYVMREWAALVKVHKMEQFSRNLNEQTFVTWKLSFDT